MKYMDDTTVQTQRYPLLVELYWSLRDHSITSKPFDVFRPCYYSMQSVETITEQKIALEQDNIDIIPTEIRYKKSSAESFPPKMPIAIIDSIYLQTDPQTERLVPRSGDVKFDEELGY